MEQCWKIQDMSVSITPHVYIYLPPPNYDMSKPESIPWMLYGGVSTDLQETVRETLCQD